MLGISKEAVNELPEVTYPGRVILIDSAAKAHDAIKYIKTQRQIGFDTETRPNFQKNHRYKVSLMQLSTPGECFLFRLRQIGSLDPLMEILEDENIQKIGLSLKDDFHSLAKLREFKPAGFVELQTFVKDYEIADNSLQKIYAVIFGRRISKNQRLTNWEAPELTLSQQSYAAIDAWACVEIYNFLLTGRFNPAECAYHIDDETALQLQQSVGIHMPLKHPEGTLAAPHPTESEAAMTAAAETEKSAEKPKKARKKADSKSSKETKKAKKSKEPKKSKETKKAKEAKKAKEKSSKEAKAAKEPKAKKTKEPKAPKAAKDSKPAKAPQTPKAKKSVKTSEEAATTTPAE